MASLLGLARRLRRVRGSHGAPYGANWVPASEAEAMDQILTNADPEQFEAAGRRDAEEVLGPLISPTDAVLDLGCGIGRVTRYVAPLCREIWAVDASETMLEMARARLADLPNVRLVLGEGTSFPAVPSESIDFAYSLLTLQHVEREHAFRLLRELRRVLLPGAPDVPEPPLGPVPSGLPPVRGGRRGRQPGAGAVLHAARGRAAPARRRVRDPTARVRSRDLGDVHNGSLAVRQRCPS